MSYTYYVCSICLEEEEEDEEEDNFFPSLADYYHHLRIAHLPVINQSTTDGEENTRRKLQCLHCPRRYKHYRAHYLKFHSRVGHACQQCDSRFKTRQAVLDHGRDNHGIPADTQFREVASSFNRRVQTFAYTFPRDHILSIEHAFEETRLETCDLILRQLALKHLFC